MHKHDGSQRGSDPPHQVQSPWAQGSCRCHPSSACARPPPQRLGRHPPCPSLCRAAPLSAALQPALLQQQQLCCAGPGRCPQHCRRPLRRAGSLARPPQLGGLLRHGTCLPPRLPAGTWKWALGQPPEALRLLCPPPHHCHLRTVGDKQHMELACAWILTGQHWGRHWRGQCL